MEPQKASPSFLLAGNSSYLNRGSEAIVRGTTAILRRSFGEDAHFALAEYGARRDIETQAASEIDPAISHIRLSYERFFSWTWLMDQCHRKLGIKDHGRHRMLRNEVGRVCASLLVGGDNYSLDYGRPYLFFDLDEYLLKHHVPAVVLWGASVGPFDADPEFSGFAHRCLSRLSAIFVRETRSLEYLRRNGISSNIRLVADPAFAMSSEAPPASYMPVGLNQNPIGLNFSPLMARYVTNGDINAWATICARGVVSIMRKMGENILLLPHVFAENNDDGDFLNHVAVLVERETGYRISVTSRKLGAAQIKWIISHCSVFVGARTHATIAAFSTCVPTLSLAYSVKARGLNEDVYGNLDYCINPQQMTAETIAGRTLGLIADANRARERLASRLPEVMTRAFAAGDYLAEILGGQTTLNNDERCSEPVMADAAE